MEIGIFSRTFQRPNLNEILAAISGHRLRLVHFNLTSAGLESLPPKIEPDVCQWVLEAFRKSRLRMTSISGTFNAIHPDKSHRRDLIHRACQLIEMSRDLGTSVVSLCTGTRDPQNMWRRHCQNQTSDAWDDLIETLNSLLGVAVRNKITLGIEPERGNVINSARRARQLLDQIESDYLKVIIDGANLFDPDEPGEMRPVLEEAFELLGADVILAHAKELADSTNSVQAAGLGRLDWSSYFHFLKLSGYDGPILLHNLNECQVNDSIAFVNNTWTSS